LDKVASQQSELLPRLGVSAGGSPKDASPDADLPSAAEVEARESIERFQKLCRDAKRRAIGA
jgi:hypothetical protein